jgi:hypothetical protein
VAQYWVTNQREAREFSAAKMIVEVPDRRIEHEDSIVIQLDEAILLKWLPATSGLASRIYGDTL